MAMRPWKTLKDLLVHPKDKQDKEDITEYVYKVPCANCDKMYVGETGRKLGVRLHEHVEVVYYHIAASGWIITGNTIIHDTRNAEKICPGTLARLIKI